VTHTICIIKKMISCLMIINYYSLAFCQQEPNEKEVSFKLFTRVFGDNAVLDPVMHNEVVSATHGLRHYRDTNHDARPDEVWFIDLALRHPEKSRPLLVKVIDEDGDLQGGGEPDLDSDLYIADWKADGTVDCVLDYTDLDADNDVDEMGIYFYGPWKGYFSEPALRVWWGRDIGDDNLLWYDVGYNYDQSLCEYRSHFGGDEIFVCFALPMSASEWIPFWENPFVFIDHDHDGATEEVVRFCGIQRDIENIRHSMDADNDSSEKNPRDYDVSISGWAPGSRLVDGSMGPGHSSLQFSEEYAETVSLRGINSAPFVSYERTLDLVPNLTWIRRQLAWDELDHNVDQQNHVSDYERWEGVISAGNEYFSQIGGPHCGKLNIRYEVDIDQATGSRVYYHPVDGRIHLTGADYSWLEVDTNLDGIVDIRYDMKDSNSDGYIDFWSIDTDKDGKPEDSWRADPSLKLSDDEYTFNNVFSLSKKAEQNLENLFGLERILNKTIKQIDGKADNRIHEIESLFPHLSKSNQIRSELCEKLNASDQSLAFVLGVSRDVLISQLKSQVTNADFWTSFNKARSIGDNIRMQELISREFNIPCKMNQYKDWKNNLTSKNEKKVAWNDQWFPPNVGWESEQIAYRCYWGQFDFFGKTKEVLIYPNLTDENYHKEQEWGIDALLVGDTAGCGGVTLYLDGNAYPVRSPRGEGKIQFTHKLLEETEQLVSIEIVAEGIGFEDNPASLRFICTSQAGHPETRIKVMLEPLRKPAKTSLGIELVRLKEETLSFDTRAGVLSSWGLQTPEIGFIGMSILFPFKQYLDIVSSATSNQVIVSLAPEEPVEYFLYCDWLNGRRFNRCPSPSDWFQRAVRLAAQLRKNNL